MGKTTLAMAAAKEFERPVYLMQCTSDTRPEDLLVVPVLEGGGGIRYHASPLLSAVIQGGICVLDEGNRMSEKSWASLAGLLDHRRTVESVVAGITVKAHPEFRCVATMNQDSSTFEIPEYIQSRLQPGIEIPYPQADEELEILKFHLPNASDDMVGYALEFLQKAHGFGLPYSLRDGLNAVSFASRILELSGDKGQDPEKSFKKALEQILGEEALDLDAMIARRKQILEQYGERDLTDFLGDSELDFE